MVDKHLTIDCPFESEVLDAVASRRWPARSSAELHAHVSSCAGCRDLAAVAHALAVEEEGACEGSRLPPAPVVWHRAQLRARDDAARAAMRPIGFVQGVAFTLGMAAVLAVAAWGVPVLMALLPDFTSAVRMPAVPRLDFETAAVLSNTAVQMVLAAAALLAPIAVYVTLRDTSS